MKILFKAITVISILSFVSLSADAYVRPHKTTARAIQSATAPSLTARLIDADNKAKKKTATVEVTVKGVALIDPATVGEKPKAGQGHLHYRVDDGPVIATTATKLSFHELTSGTHKIVVMLAANDHSPLGPQETLAVTVP
jgi:hypothetical protein